MSLHDQQVTLRFAKVGKRTIKTPELPRNRAVSRFRTLLGPLRWVGLVGSMTG